MPAGDRAGPAAPHESGSALTRRPGAAPRGDRLPGADARVDQPRPVVHQGSPTKHPARRLETIRLAGELRIPFTTGILVGIGETEEERVGALEAIAAVHAEYGHIQEVILQNFVPHPRYYGAEVADLADAASQAAVGSERTTVGSEVPLPDLGHPGHGRRHEAADRRVQAADARRGVQVPPNLADWWPELVEAGATDLGGLSANGDHISPEEPFPSPHQVRKELAPRGYALTERLCAYPQYLDPEWMEQGVLDVVKLKYWSFIPRRGSGRRQESPPAPEIAPRAIEKGRRGEELARGGADGTLLGDSPGGDRGDANRGR